jgi:BirA family biotin operon repressor/biotin-[acetyl-CoA-carboxylase] ligase
VEELDARRTPLNDTVLRSALERWPFYVDVSTSATTGSTNADVAELARSGALEGTVRATDHQTAGRGRLTRSWTSPPGVGIAVSVLLRPVAVPRDRWTWVPLLAGLAVTRTLRRAGVEAALKWPNDVLVEGAKIAGILVEVVGAGAPGAVVVGIGLNVTNQVDELPPGGTSLALAGGDVLDRTAILALLLGELADAYEPWRDAAGDSVALRADYLMTCATINREVRVELPGEQNLRGFARTVDLEGRLVVDADDGELVLGAGDVVHVR